MFTKILLPVVYIGGMGAMFLFDIAVTARPDPADVAQWALVKSVVIIGSTIVLLGADQVVVRHPQDAGVIFLRAAIHIPLLSFLYIFVLGLFGFDLPKLSTGIVVCLLAITTLIFGVFRSNQKYLAAQMINNTWKVCGLCFVGIGYVVQRDVEFTSILLWSTLLGLAFVVLPNIKLLSSLMGSTIIKSSLRAEGSGFSSNSALGLKFLISMLSLNLSLYLEQLLLNGGGYHIDSATYFTHAAFILPPIVLFNGFIGFVLGPKIRNNKGKYIGILHEKILHFMLLAFSVAICSSALGYFLIGWIPNVNVTPNLFLSCAIAGIGFGRLLYVIPSSFLGVLAGARDFSAFVVANVVAVSVLLIVYFLFLNFMSAMYAVALASMFNWGARVMFGMYLVMKVTGFEKNG